MQQQINLTQATWSHWWKLRRKNPNRWYIGHHTLNNPLTKIEVTSIGNILDHKVPIYSRFYWLIQVSSNSIGLLFLAPFFGMHWLIIYTIEWNPWLSWSWICNSFTKNTSMIFNMMSETMVVNSSKAHKSCSEILIFLFLNSLVH